MSKSWENDAGECTEGLIARADQQAYTADQPRTALGEASAHYNSALVEDHLVVDGRLLVDLASRKLKEVSLLKVLLAGGIPSPTIQFRYQLNATGPYFTAEFLSNQVYTIRYW